MKSKILFGLSLFVLVGCVDMETQPGGATVTSKQQEEIGITNPENFLKTSINAIFASLKAYMPVTGDNGTGTNRHNDFGYPSIMMFTDANGFDVVSEDNGYNWSGNELDYSDRVYTSQESLIVWNTLYKMIFAANDVISKVDPESDDPIVRFYAGQTLAVRAFDYWVGAQLYQFNYTTHKDSLCLPLITEENAVEAATEGCPRATVEQIYTQILKDIDAAIECLTFAQENGVYRDDKRYIDLAVAYGIRARVNLTMGKWTEAASDAQAAIDNSDAKPSSLEEASRPAFWTVSEKDWMWGIIIDETDDVVLSGIVNYPSHMGCLNWGYCQYSGGRQINKALFNTISATDVRRGWFLDEDGHSDNLTDEENSFMSDYIGYPPYTQCKFAPYQNVLDQDNNANDIPLMRIEEMYLILAEAKAMSNASDAKTVLTDFIKTYRDPSYECPDVTGKDLQDEVWRHRRIELWGEGLSWFDIMRLGKGVDRRGAGYPSENTIYNIPAGSPILLWRIPESEIEANKQISAEDNNPDAPAPEAVDDID